MSAFDSTQTLFPGAFNMIFKEGDTFNSVCARMAGYSTERFEAVALRFYSGDETVITVFAHDKFHRNSMEEGEARLPVHKFKVMGTIESFFKEIQQLNFTVADAAYDMDLMEVNNK